MPAKRQQASRPRLMALNSMWQTACSRAARPAGVKGERRGTCTTGTRRGSGGRPGSGWSVSRVAEGSITAWPACRAWCSAVVAAHLASGSAISKTLSASVRTSIRKIIPSGALAIPGAVPICTRMPPLHPGSRRLFVMSELHKFIFDGLPVRGMLVRLTDSWKEVLTRRQEAGAFPVEVRSLLGEMAAASTLMQANIKFNGALLLQVMGDGPVKLAVAESTSDLGFRVTAKVVGEVPEGARLEALLNVHGQGRCAITLDPKDRMPGQQPYQGVVPLHGDQREPLQQLSQVLEHYMLQSEQLDTRLVLAANDDVAAGLLIQRLPVEGEGNLEGQGGRRNEDEIGLNEAFNRIAMLAATLTKEELLALEPAKILHRLFWEET